MNGSKATIQAKKRQLKQELSHLADTTAREYNSSWHPPSSTPPVSCPTSEVELIYNKSILTSRLLQLVKSAIHDAPLQTHIISRTGWDDATFDWVDWTSHKKPSTVIAGYIESVWLSFPIAFTTPTIRITSSTKPLPYTQAATSRWKHYLMSLHANLLLLLPIEP